MRLILFTCGTAKTMVQGFGSDMDGLGAWNLLKDKFEMKGSAQTTLLQEKLYGNSMEENEDPDAYFARVEALRRNLGELGVNITDAMMLGIVLARLPVKYHHLRDVLEMTDDLTYPGLREKLGRVFRREIGSGKNPNTALMTQANTANKKVCWVCGADDHLKPDCPQRKRGEERRKCHKCGKVGHLKKDCKEAQKETNFATLTF
jgi:hypothetical protein